MRRVRRAGLAFRIGIVAALLAPAPARADGVHIEDASPAQLSAAQKTFEAADELYDSQQYDAAIKAFSTSFEIVASPNSKLMIARSMRKMGNVADAYAELEGAVELAEKAAEKDPKYAATLKAVRDELAALKSQVGILHVRFADPPAGAVVSVGERRIPVAALTQPVIVPPGAVVVVARAEGHPEISRTVEVAAGAEASVDLALAPAAGQGPAPEPPPPTTPAPDAGRAPALRTAAFVAGGVGAVGLVGFVVFGLVHRARFSELEDGCPDNRCPRDREGDIDSGRTYETLANVGLVLGVVGAGAGVTLFVLSNRKPATATSASTTVTLGPGSLQLAGRF